jgi:tetratricopeptide (TPR) repeat protein
MSKHARVGGPARCILAGAALAVLAASAAAAAQERATDQIVRFLQSRIAADPDDPLAHNRLAAAYIRKARESGDLTYYALAEQAAQRGAALVSSGPAAATANTLLATVHVARHEFRQALSRARTALDLNPSDAGPQAVAGDALLELGDYDEAARAYARLASLTGPRHPASRLAWLKFLQGDPAGAVAGMRDAVARATAASPGGEPAAWTRVQLGELLFHTGDLAGAEAAYRDALVAMPGYHAAIAGAARVAAARGRLGEAAEHYRKALDVVPLPEYAAALGDVYTRLGRAPEARKQYALVEYIGRLSALNKTVYNRELALFLADHDLRLPEALELARKELEARRDIYTYDVLAWTLYKNGQAREAQAAMTEALRLGTQDARLLFHAGMIHRALGEHEAARTALARALALNPRFHVLHAAVAAGVLAELKAGR